MTDKTRNRDDLWAEDVDDDEQTQVAVNPLYRSSIPPADLTRSQARHVSSFGTPKSSRPGEDHASGRPSLYERLLHSGALDEGIAVEAERESARPLDPGPRKHSLPELPPPPDLRDLAEALEGRDSDTELMPRDSAEELRPSDIDVVAVEPARTLTPAGSRTLANLPRPIPASNVPSILLGPGASTRNDVTERFSHMPSTHPLANSISPTVPSVRPQPVEEKRMPMWQVAAAALVLIGFGAAIGSYRARSTSAPEDRAAAAVAPQAQTPADTTPRAPAAALPAPADAIADEPKAIEPAAAQADEAAEAKAQAADEAPAEEEMTDEERRRERRHAERAAAEAAAKNEVQPLPSEVASAAAAGEPERPAEPVAQPEPARPARTQPAAPSGPVPAQPSREQVVATMDSMVPELAKCVGDKHGAANVTMTVRSAGTVSYALVGGSFAGTPEGSCIARVIKQAQFPAFSDASIRVSYPFQL